MRPPTEDGCAASRHAQNHSSFPCLSRSLICPELPRFFFSDAIYAVFIVPTTLGVWDKYGINSVSLCVETCRF